MKIEKWYCDSCNKELYNDLSTKYNYISIKKNYFSENKICPNYTI